MILVFDTETTGKADMASPVSVAHQPRIVQLAAVLYTDSGREVSSMNCIIKPDGWTIPKEASDIHGITDEMAEKEGIDITLALAIFDSLFSWEKTTIVGHNVAFDIFMYDIELHRLMKDMLVFCPLPTPAFCTMKATTNLCRLPGMYGKHKWPKLSEAYKFLFNEELVGAHDALVDVRAVARIYFELQSRSRRAKQSVLADSHLGNSILPLAPSVTPSLS